MHKLKAAQQMHKASYIRYNNIFFRVFIERVLGHDSKYISSNKLRFTCPKTLSVRMEVTYNIITNIHSAA
jgi:hypothetical protein